MMKNANHAHAASPASVPLAKIGMITATITNTTARPQRLWAGVVERGVLFNDALLCPVPTQELDQGDDLPILSASSVDVA